MIDVLLYACALLSLLVAPLCFIWGYGLGQSRGFAQGTRQSARFYRLKEIALRDSPYSRN